MHKVLNNMKSILDKHGLTRMHNTNSSLLGNYHPECDATPEYNVKNTRLCASLIEMLQ